jgi:large conductance mechanosensitive channel
MPPVGLLLGGVDFSDLYLLLKEGTKAAPPYGTLAAAQAAGAVTLNYGLLINNVLSFVIVAFAVFMLVKSFNRMRREEEKPPEDPKTKECPECASEIAVKAKRCPQCTSTLA